MVGIIGELVAVVPLLYIGAIGIRSLVQDRLHCILSKPVFPRDEARLRPQLLMVEELDI